MNEKLKVILTELRSHFEEVYGDRLVKMILFGSQARGDADFGSDIDVLVVLKGEVNPGEEIERTGEVVAKLSLHYEEVISRIFMSEHQFLHRQSPLLKNISREGIML